MFTCASPPRRCPMKAWLNCTSRSVIPPRFITSPHEQEEGQGHQREAVHAIVEIAVEQREVAFLPVEPQQNAGREKQREKDRQAYHQEDEEDRQEPDQHLLGLRQIGM